MNINPHAESRLLRELSANAYRDIKNGMDAAKREGMEKGIAIGTEKGIAIGTEKEDEGKRTGGWDDFGNDGFASGRNKEIVNVII